MSKRRGWGVRRYLGMHCGGVRRRSFPESAARLRLPQSLATGLIGARPVWVSQHSSWVGNDSGWSGSRFRPATAAR